MDPRANSALHPSMAAKYSFVLEAKLLEPSKRSYATPEEVADIGLRQGMAKFKDKLLNVYVMEGDRIIGSYKDEQEALKATLPKVLQ